MNAIAFGKAGRKGPRGVLPVFLRPVSGLCQRSGGAGCGAESLYKVRGLAMRGRCFGQF
jgi:hypothetical protein